MDCRSIIGTDTKQAEQNTYKSEYDASQYGTDMRGTILCSDITVSAEKELNLNIGKEVYIGFKTMSVEFYQYRISGIIRHEQIQKVFYGTITFADVI